MHQPDVFPREDLGRLLRRIPAYARLAWNLGRDPALSRARRAAVLGAAGYLISPIDAIPGIIPLLGQLDDLLVLMLALRFALAGLDAGERAARLAAVGLSDALLADDLRTLATAMAWLARRGSRLAVRVGVGGARTGAAVIRRVAPIGAGGARQLSTVAGDRMRALARRRRAPVDATGVSEA